MRNIKVLVLAVILALTMYLARHAFIWASTPVTGTTSFDYFMSGVFAVFGVFTLAFFVVMLVYSIMEKPTQETTTVETPVDTTTVHTAPVLNSTDAYIARRQAEIDAYTARRTAEIQAYHARRTAEIQAYREFRQL